MRAPRSRRDARAAPPAPPEPVPPAPPEPLPPAQEPGTQLNDLPDDVLVKILGLMEGRWSGIDGVMAR